MARTTLIGAGAGALLGAGALAPAWAQPSAPPAGQTPTRLDLSELPPALALGVRASLTHRTQVSVPVLVIAPDEAAYVRAIEGWAGVSRYPVLIDDGTLRAAERIGQFVRAFGPEEIVRLAPTPPRVAEDEEGAGGLGSAGSFVTGADAEEAEPGAPTEVIEPLPEGRDELGERLTLAWVRAMDVANVVRDREGAISLMRSAGYAPPAVVVVDPQDPAWAGGLALASAHLCPMVFVDAPRRDIDAVYTHEQADALAKAIEDDLAATNLLWGSTHDDIEAVALCLNAPAKIRIETANGREHVALTDRIGRHTRRGEGARWAWCSQVHGSASESAWRAMCAIFLTHESAWVFDGYPGTDPWTRYDGSEAAEELRSAGMRVTVHDQPDNGEANWRHAVSRGVSADLLLINSKGQPTMFQLDPGELGAGDMPVLDRPAALHLVHSFAFQRPGNDRTVGGRLMAHGVYAAVGAVDEPFLQGFVPTPMVARRLRAGYPWAAAGRVDAGPPWRIATLGDPLMTTTAPPRRGEADAGLRAVATLDHEPLDEARARAVRDKDWASALRLLVMSGRDEDAARLAASLLQHAPDDVTPEAAAVALGALFRAGRLSDAIAAYERMAPDARRDPVNADIFWNAARARFRTTNDGGLIGIMDANLRDGQAGYDLVEVSEYVARASGLDAARTYLGRAKERVTSSRDRDMIDRAIRRLDR